MTKFTTVYNNFSGGKVSEKFKGRFDTKQYQNSLEECKNFLFGKVGGIYKRTGTVLVHDLTNVSSGFTDTHTPIMFDTGRGSSYTLYLPNTTVKLDGAPSSPVYIILNDGNGISSPTEYGLGSGIAFKVPGGYPAWPSSNGVTFSEGHWISQQVGDFLFITHSSGEQRPLVIARTSPSTFEINYYDYMMTQADGLSYAMKGPYKKNTSAVTMAYLTNVITASAAYFTAGMVGSWIRINVGGSSGVYVITGYTDSTHVAATAFLGATTAGATDDWSASAWNDEFGWPTAVTFHNQRLFWGGSPNKNFDSIWASRTGNLFHMSSERLDQDHTTDVSGANYFGPVVFATDPTDFRPASTQSNAVTWLSGGRTLMSGTTGGENLINLGVDSLDIKENSNYGSYNSQVVKAGKDVIFVGKDRRSLRTYRYSEENGSWLSDDLSSKADTLFLDGAILAGDFPTIKQISWNSENKHLWVLMSNGDLKILSYDVEFGLNGWTEFEIGGETTRDILGVHNMPSPDRSRVETYISVSRTLEDGPSPATTNIFLEKIIGEFNNTSINAFTSTDFVDYPRYLDFAQLSTANGSGVAATASLAYLGNTFDCIVMTATAVTYVLGVVVVDVASSPNLDYTFPANAKVIYGYNYSAELKTLSPEGGGQFGTSMADVKHIHETFLRLYRSMDFSIGSIDKDSGLELTFEDVTYADLTSEDKRIFTTDNPDTDGQIIVRNTTPTPLNILSIISKGVAYD